MFNILLGILALLIFLFGLYIIDRDIQQEIDEIEELTKEINKGSRNE